MLENFEKTDLIIITQTSSFGSIELLVYLFNITHEKHIKTPLNDTISLPTEKEIIVDTKNARNYKNEKKN